MLAPSLYFIDDSVDVDKVPTAEATKATYSRAAQLFKSEEKLRLGAS